MKILVVGSRREVLDLSGAVHKISGYVPIERVDALSTEKISSIEETGLDRIGYDTVYYPENTERLETPDQVSAVVTELVKTNNYDYVLALSLKLYRESLAMTGQALSIPLIADVVSIDSREGRIVFVRNIMAGRVRSLERPLERAIVLVGPGRFREERVSDRKTLFTPLRVATESRVRVLEKRPKAVGAVRLEEAEIIVSVGRGFRSREDLKYAFELAEILGGQVGCSRPIAADLKWLPEAHWIGLSGKKVRPRLYIALGISGQPQHIAGIIDSRIVVAVNKDPSAPIFKNADYGIVGDLYEFIPVFREALKRLLGK